MSLFSSLCASLVRPASFACPGLRAAAPLALSCAVLGALAPAAVQAQLRSDELRPLGTSGYVGLNIGRSKFDPDCVPGRSCDSGRTGYKLFAGTQADNLIGAEIGYINMGKIDYAGGYQKAHGFNLSLTGTLPIGAGFSGFGKIGGTYGWTKTRSNAAGARTGDGKGLGLSYGLGLGYRFSPDFEVVAEYERHRFDFAPGDQTIGFTSIGLRVKY